MRTIFTHSPSLHMCTCLLSVEDHSTSTFVTAQLLSEATSSKWRKKVELLMQYENYVQISLSIRLQLEPHIFLLQLLVLLHKTWSNWPIPLYELCSSLTLSDMTQYTFNEGELKLLLSPFPLWAPIILRTNSSFWTLYPSSPFSNIFVLHPLAPTFYIVIPL